MPSGASGQPCGTCDGSGSVPTDTGPVSCPDCGGAGVLPAHDTFVEWRLRELERHHGARDGEIANDIRWLAFELRRARAALTEVLTLSAEEIDDPAAVDRLRFVANQALGLYEITVGGAPAVPPGKKPD